MKVAVSYDERGEIFVLFNPETLRTEKWTTEYVPQPNENHQVLDLPAEFDSLPFEGLAKVLRVNTSGSGPKLERRP